MIQLAYSLVIEATEEPDFFGFRSPDLPGFSGVGHSIEDCVYRARHGFEEHVRVMRGEGMSPPEPNPNPTILIRNEQPQPA